MANQLWELDNLGELVAKHSRAIYSLADLGFVSVGPKTWQRGVDTVTYDEAERSYFWTHEGEGQTSSGVVKTLPQLCDQLDIDHPVKKEVV